MHRIQGGIPGIPSGLFHEGSWLPDCFQWTLLPQQLQNKKLGCSYLSYVDPYPYPKGNDSMDKMSGLKNLIFWINVFFSLKHGFRMFSVNKFHDNSFHCIGWVCFKRKSMKTFDIHRWYIDIWVFTNICDIFF